MIIESFNRSSLYAHTLYNIMMLLLSCVSCHEPFVLQVTIIGRDAGLCGWLRLLKSLRGLGASGIVLLTNTTTPALSFVFVFWVLGFGFYLEEAGKVVNRDQEEKPTETLLLLFG